MVWGEINSLEPPYIVQISATKDLPPDVIERLNWIMEDLATQQAEFRERHGYDVDVAIEIMS